MSDQPIRYELRIKNRVLWEAIHAVWPSVAALCRESGFPNRQAQVGDLLRLQKSAYRTAGKGVLRPTGTARWLSQVLKIGVAELFPPALYEARFPKLVVGSGSIETAIGLLDLPPEQRMLPSPEDTGGVLDNIALEELLARWTTDRERFVLTQHYLCGRSLDDIGEEMGVTQERVRQIEVHATRRLRKHTSEFFGEIQRRRARAAPADLPEVEPSPQEQRNDG